MNTLSLFPFQRRTLNRCIHTCTNINTLLKALFSTFNLPQSDSETLNINGNASDCTVFLWLQSVVF